MNNAAQYKSPTYYIESFNIFLIEPNIIYKTDNPRIETHHNTCSFLT